MREEAPFSSDSGAPTDPFRLLEGLDSEDPFEIDDRNRAHLAKHPPYTEEDIYDAYWGDPVFAPSKPPAELLMIGSIPGDWIVVPLVAGSRQGKLRPIGIFKAGKKHMDIYVEVEGP